MTLGERIKEQRNKLGFSQEKIAELVGTSRQAVTKWEADQSIPCMKNLITLAEIFGISLSELSKGTDENIPKENAAEENPQLIPQKSLLLLDIIFVLVAFFAAWNILKLPALIGYSIVGFFAVIMQIAAVLYIPIYLFLIRPWRKKHIKVKEPIGKAKVLDRIFWTIGAASSLLVCYFLFRHIFYELLGNKEWPFVLFVFGLAVIFIAAFTGSKKVMICTVTGYMASFIIGIVFNSDYYMYESRYNNAWQIWTVSFLVIIVAGIIWEVVSNLIKSKRSS